MEKLSKAEMKQIKGGLQAPSSCSGSCTCSGGHSGTLHPDKGVASGCACVCVY